MKETILKGVSVSSGIGIGRPFLVATPKMVPKRFPIPDLHDEIKRYQNAVDASIYDLQDLQRQLREEKAYEGIKVLDTHLQLLQDPIMTSEIIKEIKRTNKSGMTVLHRALLSFKSRFGSLSNPFFQERFLDFQDVCDRVMNHLQRKVHLALSNLPRGSIIFADDLTPSEVATLKIGMVAGLVTKRGGMTSHAAIIAKSKGIPYVAHLDFSQVKFPSESLIIVDGRKGEVFFHPEQETMKRFDRVQKKMADFHFKLEQAHDLSPSTEDGCEIRLYLNVNHPKDVENINMQWDGIGLFRTEFLLHENRQVPSEDEQCEIYKSLLQRFADKSCAIRVFDVGGEKATLIHTPEHNPSLGCRAIRFLLQEEKVFKTQVRALLRASPYGNLRILLPMISNIEELRECRKRIEEIKNELHAEGYITKESIPVGCMVEVPSAALIADHLARESDFLSFGTNDLVQYTLAVDRSNHLVTNIYSPFHPGMIRLIKHVIREANKKQVPLSICGEVASDPRYTPLLIGLGLRELSLSKHSYSMIKHTVRHCNLKGCQSLAKKVLTLSSSTEIESLLTQFYTQLVPEEDDLSKSD